MDRPAQALIVAQVGSSQFCKHGMFRQSASLTQQVMHFTILCNENIDGEIAFLRKSQHRIQLFRKSFDMVITIGAEKGGVAKTRLATHIAALAATNGVDVVLLDTDKQGSAMSWSKIRNDEGVIPSIPVLALPPNPARELANLSKKYTLVVVDIGAQNYRTMLECALLSDIVLVPCGSDQQEVESTLNVFDTLKEMGPRHESGEIPAHVVLTRVSPLEGSKATAELREFFAGEGVSVFKSQIAHRASWLATGKSGRAVHELKGRERSQKAVDEMQAVYDEILSRINAEEQ